MKNLLRIKENSFYPVKFDLKMKLSVLFLLVTLFQLRAFNSYSQNTKVSLDLKEVSIEQVFKEIESQTKFKFFYNIEDVNVKRIVSIKLNRKHIEAVLNQLFKGSEVKYKLVDRQVILTKIRPTTKMPEEAFLSQDPIKVSGKVVDENGNALPGVTIRIKDTNTGVATDFDGNYTITVSSSENILVFTSVGFATQEITVGDQIIINVELKESSMDLGEVVITGYRNISKPRSTGSVGTVTAQEIRESGAVSMDQVLRGKIPGIVALNLSGRPGATAQIRIRGLNSITGNMEPIWIVDGIEMREAVPNISVGGVNLQNSILTNGIGSIIPEDIASITVLKDAAASALYGARAANGVIVVTTKRGTAGDNRINVSSSFSLSEAPTNRYEMMNTAEKIQYERDLAEDKIFSPARGRASVILSEVTLGRLSEAEGEAMIAELAKVDTDWFDVIFRPAFSWRHNISMSGGTQKMQYYGSASLGKEKGILKRNELSTFNSSAKLTVLPIPRLRIETQLRMSVRKDIAPNPIEDPFRYATFANPYEKPYNDDGSYAYDRSYNRETLPLDLFNYKHDYNILEDMETSTIKNNSSSLTVDGRIAYDIFKNLSVDSQIQYVYSSSYGRDWAEPGSYASYKRNVIHNSEVQFLPEELNNGYLRETHGDSESYTFKNLLTYNANVNDTHFVNVLFGQEASKTNTGNFFNLLPDYNPDFLIGGYPTEMDPRIFDNPYNDPITFDTYNFELLGNTGINEQKTASFFMNASYSYKDIYVFNGSIRYDGVDIIGNKNNFTPLWNLSGKWNLSGEKFMQNVDFVQVLSLRGSLGYTGSIDRNALPFTYLRFHNIFFYDGAMMPTQINWKNPNVKWQKKLDRNIGLDASLFKSKLNIEFNYYNNRVIDLLDDKQLPVSTGASTIRANVASLTNSGIELDVNTFILNNTNWRWMLSFNLSKNTNKITKTFYQEVSELPVVEQNWPPASVSKYYTVGYDQSAIFGYEFAGVDPITGNTLIYANNEEHLNPWELHSERDGRKIMDMDRYFNHEASISYLGNTQPSYAGGFGTSLSYKAFTLAAQFAYAGGNLIRSPSTTDIWQASRNLLRNTANRWRQPGDITEIPEIIVRSQGGNAYSKYFFDSDMEKGDFLKLTYINLSYDLPSGVVKKLGMQRCRFGLNANNLFTWTKYKGIDPENNGTFGYPSARKYTANLEITF